MLNPKRVAAGVGVAVLGLSLSWGQPALADYGSGATLARAVPTGTVLASWQVSPGVTYTRTDLTDERGPVRAHLLTIDMSTPGLKLDYATVGDVRDDATVPEILAVDRAIAGVNGDFYDIKHTGAPLGIGRDRQDGLLHAPQLGWNNAFYLDGYGHPQIGPIAMIGKIRELPGIRITNYNSPYVVPGGVGLYTAGWGLTSGYRVTQGQQDGVRMVVVKAGKVVKNTRLLTRKQPIEGFLLIGRDEGATALRALTVGSPVHVSRRLDTTTKMVITGDRFLLNDGVVTVVNNTDLHPRTAVGIDYDTNRVFLLVIDGRQDASRGYSMVELANLMLSLGADDALNLDGGGSSTMVAKRPSGKVRVVNVPSDGFLRPVANALEVTYRAP